MSAADDALYLNASTGQCCFLDDDRRCILHKELGAAAKPAICRAFPHERLEDGAVTRLGVGLGCIKQFEQTLASEPAAPAEHWRALNDELDPRLTHHYDAGESLPVESEILAAVRGATDPVSAVLAIVVPQRAPRPPPGARAPGELAERSLHHLRRVEADLAADPLMLALCERVGLLPERVRAIRALARGGTEPGGAHVEPGVLPTGPRLAILRDALFRFHFLRLYLLFPDVPCATAGFLLGVWTSAAVTSAGERADARFGESLATWVRIIQSSTLREAMFQSPGEVSAYLEAFTQFWAR
jgi:hypothetical protein